MPKRHLFPFLKALFLNPRKTGAILPSSKQLATQIAHCIQASQTDYVVELGAGTGVITEAILASDINPANIIVVERAKHLAEKLTRQFPTIHVIHSSATELTKFLNDYPKVQSIVSSLPLRSLSKTDREIILSQIPIVLAPHGQFIQFTYDLRKNSRFYPKNFQLVRSFIVWQNLPPARVTVFRIA